jgi:hypothetical protein
MLKGQMAGVPTCHVGAFMKDQRGGVRCLVPLRRGSRG